MVLTEKQRQDLHQSMMDYLVGMGERFAETAAAFERESGVNRSLDGKHAGLLEKKWTSVIRLQKKILELESKLQQAEDVAKRGSVVSRREATGGIRDRKDFLPRDPPKFSLAGHRSPITCVVFHPVYSVLASSSEDATIKIYDFETGEYERTLKGHTNSVQSIAFNATGTLLVSSSSDLTIKLWDFVVDGQYECIRTLRGHDHNVCGVIFAPSGDRILSCSRDHTIKLWDISTGYCVHTLNGHSDWVRDLAVSSDGNFLASCGNDRSILLWDLQSFRLVQSMREHEHVIESVVFTSTEAQDRLIEKMHGKKLMLPPPSTSTTVPMDTSSTDAGPMPMAVDSVDSSSNHQVTGSQAVDSTRRVKFLLSGARDRTVRLWEAHRGILLMTFSSHENWVRCVRFHSSGKYAVSVAEDKTLRVFDLETGRNVRTIEEAHSHFLTCVDVHSSVPLMITGGIDKVTNVWECD